MTGTVLDPDGDLHPLHYTARIGDADVQVTTVPLLYAALPLWRRRPWRRDRPSSWP